MELPSAEQIDEAIAESRRLGESEEQLEARIESLCRWSDDDLAAIGVVPCQPPEAPPEPALPAPAAELPEIDFPPAELKRRHDGWTAQRQRSFIATLAETGCVSEACAEVGLTPRSAYRLREHPAAAGFRAAWDHARSLATARLSALAFERAVHGTAEQYYRDGQLVAERRRPNDRLLMWLLAHHDPSTYGWASKPPGNAPDLSFFKVEHARQEIHGITRTLADVAPQDCPAERLSLSSFDPLEPPGSRARIQCELCDLSASGGFRAVEPRHSFLRPPLPLQAPPSEQFGK